MNQDQFVTASPSQFGGTFLSREIKKIEDTIDVKLAAIDEALQTALEKIIGEDNVIQYQAKPLNIIASEKPNTGDINMNGKQLTNVAGVPDISENGLSQYALFGVNVATMIAYDTASLLLNTAYCGPLSSTTSLKDKRITNVGDPILLVHDDPDGLSKLKQGVNMRTLTSICLTTAPEDRTVYAANDKKITELADALLYKDSDIRTQPDPLEANVLNVDPSVLQKYRATAMNLKSVQDVAVSLDTDTRTHFVAQSKQIKKGLDATDDDDFVTLRQTVHREEGQAEWISTDPVSEPQRRDFVFEDDRIVFVSNPKTNILAGKFAIFEDSDTVIPSRFISEDKQVANLAHVKKETDKCVKIDEDIDLKDGHRVRNALPAAADDDYVINSQCKARSGKKEDGTGVELISILGGILGGVLSGAVSGGVAAFGTIVGTGLSGGLTAIGSITGSTVAGASSGALAGGGMAIGSAAALEVGKEVADAGMKQLIDNVVDDMANSVPPIDTGMVVSSVTGFQNMLSAVANAQTSLFAII